MGLIKSVDRILRWLISTSDKNRVAITVLIDPSQIPKMLKVSSFKFNRFTEVIRQPFVANAEYTIANFGMLRK